MDPALVARAVLVVDSRAAPLKESGDVVQGIREGRFDETHIAAELGQVAADPKLGRTGSDQLQSSNRLAWRWRMLRLRTWFTAGRFKWEGHRAWLILWLIVMTLRSSARVFSEHG